MTDDQQNIDSSPYRIHWVLFLIVALALGAYVGWNQYSDYRFVNEEERSRLQTQSTVIEQNLMRQLKALDASLISLRDDLPLLRAQGNADELLTRRMLATANAAPGIRTIILVGADGLSIASNRTELVGQNFYGSERFQIMRSGADPAKLYILAPFVTPLGNYALGAGKVVLDTAGKFAGYLLAVIDPAFFETLLGSVLYAPDMRATVIHSDGSVVVRVPDPEKVTGRNVSPPGSFFFRHMQSGAMTTVQSGSTYATREPRLTVMRTIPASALRADKSLIVAVSRETPAIFALWRKATTETLGLFGLLALSSGLALLLHQRRQQAFDRLATDAERERQQAAEKTRQSEENLRITLNSIGDGVLVTDAAGQITMMNPTAERLTCWPLADAAGRPLQEIFRIVNAETRATVDNPAQLVMERGEIVGLANHTMLIARDGTEYQIADSAAPIRNNAGLITGVVVVFSDVTGQYRMQQELRERDALLHTLSDHALVGMAMFNEERRYMFANGAYCDLLGLPSTAVVGKRLQDVLGPVYETQIKPRLDRAFAGERVEFERTLAPRPPDRHERHYAVSYAPPVKTSHGPCVIGMLMDITRLRHAERERIQLAAIIESSHDAIYSRTLDGTILSWNAGAEKMFGYTAAEAIGRASTFTLAPGQPPTRDENNASLLRGEPASLEMDRMTKDGRRLTVVASLSPIKDDAGTVTGASVIFRDITAHKKAEAARATLEAQLREAHKMQAVGTLAGGIAHDFNNIIAAILGNAELAKDDIQGNSGATESIEEIIKAGARARELVRQILSFSRRQPTELKLTQLEPVVHETARLLRKTLLSRVSLEVHCAPDVPAVMADATQIEQVLINLATNALHAIKGAGRIRIALETIMPQAQPELVPPALRDLQARHPGPLVRIAVNDTGAGMSMETLERIFEPFYTTKPVNEGTGLGLSVVHGIVLTHNGAIVVESELGKGSTFYAYLPVATKTEQAAGEAALTNPQKSQSISGLRVMYIDDDELLINLMRRSLRRHGFHVSTYSHQEAALDALRAHPDDFDLLVTDYNMPGLSGLEIAREARSIRATLPVVMASGFIDDNLVEQAKEAGVSELFSKADSAEELCAIVERLARRL